MPLTVKTGAMKVKDPTTGNYVDVDMSLGVDYAPINSPAFSGTPTAPTPTSTDDSTKIATTAFAQGLVSAEASARQAADTALDNTKINAEAIVLNDLSLLGYKSLFFVTTQNVPIGSTGVSIPSYSRCAFINYYSYDGALFAITTNGSVITAFRNNGAWINANQNATITDVQNAQNYSYEYVTLSNKSGNSVAYKVGHIVFFTSANDFNTLSQGFETIGQLPNGYFPLMPVRTNITNYPAAELFFVEIDTGGSIRVYSANESQSARNGSFWAMWMTA